RHLDDICKARFRRLDHGDRLALGGVFLHGEGGGGEDEGGGGEGGRHWQMGFENAHRKSTGYRRNGYQMVLQGAMDSSAAKSARIDCAQKSILPAISICFLAVQPSFETISLYQKCKSCVCSAHPHPIIATALRHGHGDRDADAMDAKAPPGRPGLREITYAVIPSRMECRIVPVNLW